MTAHPLGGVRVEVCLGTTQTLVEITGRIDAHTVAEIREALHEAVDHGAGAVVVCITHAEIGDSVGLGVLVGAHARARRAGRSLVISGMSSRTDRLLRVSRLNRVLLGRLPEPTSGVAPLTA